LDDIKKAADAEHSKEEPTTGNRSRKRKASAEELTLKKKLTNLKKDGNKTGKDKEQLTQEAAVLEKEANEALEEAEKAAALAEAAVASSAARPKKKVKVTLFDLTEDAAEEDAKAPARAANTKATTHVSPALKWHQEACHVATLWFHLHFFLCESVLRGDVTVDYDKIAKEDEKANAKFAADNAAAALAAVKKKPNLTAKEMETTLKKHSGSDEEMHVNKFVRRAFIRLGFLECQEFCPPGSQQPKLSKAQAKNVVSSLKSWMIEFDHRKMLCNVLRVAEQLHEKKAIGALKKLVKGPLFNCQEKDRVCKMLDLVTQTQGIEKKDARKKKGKKSGTKTR